MLYIFYIGSVSLENSNQYKAVVIIPEINDQ